MSQHRADNIPCKEVDHYEAIDRAEYVQQQCDNRKKGDPTPHDWFMCAAYLDLLAMYEALRSQYQKATGEGV